MLLVRWFMVKHDTRAQSNLWSQISSNKVQIAFLECVMKVLTVWVFSNVSGEFCESCWCWARIVDRHCGLVRTLCSPPKVDLRGHPVPDRMHRRNDGIVNAFKAARCQAVPCEGVILFGFFKGAFGQNSTFFIWEQAFMQW